MYPFRVFIAYSHEDRQLAEQLVKTLQGMGLEPMWDKDIRPGMPFTDAVKGMITYAHIFMPLITENSQHRPWVHQETGYAMALNIPILPLATGNLPGEMLTLLQAVIVKPDLSDLAERLQTANIPHVVSPPPLPHSMIEVADWPERRTELMAQYANRVVEFGKYGRLRQRGALSSFCIPNKDVNDRIWTLRDGNNIRTTYSHHLSRQERIALEVHARACGCSLIIDPTIDFSERGATTTRARLSVLLEFLESMPDDKVKVVMSPQAREGNLTIVGDWFVAESLVPRPEGYRQTVFSWHAPTVLRWVSAFDQQFEELYAESGLGPNKSRRKAIEKIKKIIRRLPKYKGSM